jgi:myo-inositol catabolism protein IolC
MTLLRTLNLDYDLVEVHYNELLKNKPYLVRVFSYYHNDDPTELRLDEEQVNNLYQTLKEHYLL